MTNRTVQLLFWQIFGQIMDGVVTVNAFLDRFASKWKLEENCSQSTTGKFKRVINDGKDKATKI